MAIPPPPSNFFLRRFYFLRRWVKDILTSGPAVIVNVIAFTIIAFMFFIYYFLIDPNFGAALSFAVTVAAFFVALVIFKIQTYVKPLCSLFIQPQILDPNYHEESYRILVSLNIDNIGQSRLKSKVFNWTVSEYMKINNKIHRVRTNSKESWSTDIRDIPKNKSHSVELFSIYPILDKDESDSALYDFSVKNKFYDSSHRILVEIQNHEFIIKYVFRSTTIYFSSDEFQNAILKALETLDNAFKAPCPAIEKLKIERIWEYQSNVDRPPLG